MEVTPETTGNIIINSSMVEMFLSMFDSTDNDGKFALEILNNRDKTNEESEAQFNIIKDKIANADTIFPSTQYSGHWVVKLTHNNKIIRLAQKSYDSKRSAENGLAWYLRHSMNNKYHIPSKWKALKNIFGNAKTLMNFLVDNNVIYITELK